jgi:hypothetical protein
MVGNATPNLQADQICFFSTEHNDNFHKVVRSASGQGRGCGNFLIQPTVSFRFSTRRLRRDVRSPLGVKEQHQTATKTLVAKFGGVPEGQGGWWGWGIGGRVAGRGVVTGMSPLPPLSPASGGEGSSLTMVEGGVLNSPPLEGCPKGGVVGGFTHEAWYFVFLVNHPVRLRRPPLQRRGIFCPDGSPVVIARAEGPRQSIRRIGFASVRF